MAAATITSKGQVTIPVQVRAALGVDAGDRIEFIEVAKGEFNIVAATRSVKELDGLLYRKGRKRISIEEMNAAIAKGAARSASGR
jgi:antitoxin PrlF